jgi:DNA (cytosine-5)-methyltransferase 1
LRAKYNSIELFAGAGGLALGLQQSGFRVRALIEQDKWCCWTLCANASAYFPHACIIRKNLRRLSSQELLRRAGLHRSEIDLVSGGPPCQSFSISKIPKGGRSRNDPRDELLGHFVRFIKKIRPRTFLLENVPGLLSKSEGRLFCRLLTSFRRLGYLTQWRVINAANYGVPQSRRRLFVVGTSQRDVNFIFPAAKYGRESDGCIPQMTIGETISFLSPRLPNQEMPKSTVERRRLLESIEPGSEWKHWRHRDRWDGQSRCLTAHCRYDWIHPLEPRPGTVRELASLQTFPYDFVFCGPTNAPHDSKFASQYRQIGNSVPVLLAKAMGEGLIKYLGKVAP